MLAKVAVYVSEPGHAHPALPIDQDVVVDADGVGFQRHNFTHFFVEYFCRAVDPEV